MEFPAYESYQWARDERDFDASLVVSRRVPMRPILERNRKRQMLKKLFADLSEFSLRLRRAVGLR